MSFLKKMFKPKPVDFVSPFRGEIIELKDVKDEVFASKSMGDGLAIVPQLGEVYSPVNGTIEALFPTMHAIGIKAEDRNQYLIHIGLDTVKLKGEGFTCFVKQGDTIKQGQLLVKFDLEKIHSEHIDLTSPIIVTNLNGRTFELLKRGQIHEKEAEIFTIKN